MSAPLSAPAAAPPQAASGLRARYDALVIERGLEADAAQVAALARLEDLRARLTRTGARPVLKRLRAALGMPAPPPRGVYLHGGVGRGKTLLMDLFASALPAGCARRLHFHRFMHDVHRRRAAQRGARAPLEGMARAVAREVRVLCFDELYVSDIADAMILGGLFTALFRAGVTLVATSNVPPGELYRGGLQRERFEPAIALIEQHLESVHLDGGTDYRLRHYADGGVYLPAADPATAARLERLYLEIAGPEAPLTGTIEIEGRPIAVRRAGAGAVWFDFAAVCGPGRSADDYIEIARTWRAVFVSGVPVLDARHEDEARRFIALVDELYDHDVDLVVSAAAPPAQLYQGTRLAALYARTASRLIEMQGTDYLGRAHRP